MSTELRVLVSHLGDLAATHGTISAATAAAVADAARVRGIAAARMEATSAELQNRLREAAVSSTRTDERAGEEVGS